MAIPDWQLPPGVDRGLWNYLHAEDMVAGYDEQVRASKLAAVDLAYCQEFFPSPGRLVDLGCGTGRLCVAFAARGFDCVGVDLSEAMLAKARQNGPAVLWVRANLVDLGEFAPASFDYAACLFSTLGMIRGAVHRATVVRNAYRLLRPGGRFVLHAHNRFFRGLGRGRVLTQLAKTVLGRADAGDITMPPAYGGAPLTLHHFTRRELVNILREAGFRVIDVRGIDVEGRSAGGTRAYGWLSCGERSR